MCKKFQELTGEKVPRFTALDPGSFGFESYPEASKQCFENWIGIGAAN